MDGIEYKYFNFTQLPYPIPRTNICPCEYSSDLLTIFFPGSVKQRFDKLSKTEQFQ